MKVGKRDSIISVSGRIDSNNYEDFKNELFKLATEDNIILDVEEMEYISSAGLRVFLQLSKSGKKLNIKNVNEEVYSIFDMTGFTEMFDIQKKIRKLSINGLKKIGEGQTGAVFRINDEQIVKVFNNSVEYDLICREREIARRALVAGVPTCISFEVVKVDDRYGIVYELINSETLEELIAKNPKDDRYIKKYVDLLKDIHKINFAKYSMDKGPSLLTRFIGAAETLKNKFFSEEEVEKIQNMFRAVGEADTFIHGDAHPGNIMVQNGDLLFIDMTTSGCGNYMLDIITAASHFSTWRKIRTDEEYLAEYGYTKEDAIVLWDKFLGYYFETDDKEFKDSIEKKLDAFNAFKYILGALHSSDEKMKSRIPIYVDMVRLAID